MNQLAIVMYAVVVLAFLAGVGVARAAPAPELRGLDVALAVLWRLLPLAAAWGGLVWAGVAGWIALVKWSKGK